MLGRGSTFAGALAKIRAWATASPTLVDALLAGCLYVALTVGVTTEAEVDHGGLVGAVLNLALVAPLALRRRYPLAVLAATAVAAAVVSVAIGPTGGEAATLVALGTVAAREPHVGRLTLAVATTAAVAVAVVLLLGPDHLPEQLVVVVAAIVLAVGLGLGTRARRAELAALAERAARLERERAQDAQLAVAAERAGIASELHDVVAHNVSVMVALADGAQHVMQTSPDEACERPACRCDYASTADPRTSAR